MSNFCNRVGWAKHSFGLLVVTLTLAAPATVTAQSQEPVDLDAIYRIKAEGFQRSQILETLEYLTDVHGPRLTGSPNARAAAEYAMAKLREWGMETVKLEQFPFGRGWANNRTVALGVDPQAFPIIAYAKAWTPGTLGLVRAEATLVVIRSEQDFEEYRGTLRGKAVLTQPAPRVEALFEPPGRRFTDDDLAGLAMQPDPSRPPRRFRRGNREFTARRMQFFLDEGVVALIEPGTGRGDSGSVRVGSGGSRNPDDPPVPPQLVFASEHYGRIARMLDKDLSVTLELDIQNQFYDDTLDSFNIVAELPGTDRPDEIVMLGAHFDSWHAGTGATDNAAGSAVMLEAIRILAATGLDLKLRRTVRLALWTGEEQGLLGSRAYVKAHFGDRETMALEPEHATLSGYFNLDNGTGAIRGVYLQGHEAIAPIFDAWMQPFANIGMTTLAIRNTGGTDHLSFNAVGLPGFQFIQDPVEYGSRSHHSNLDLYERIQPADMMQNAVIVASFVYHAATRDELLPRKPLPEPQGSR